MKKTYKSPKTYGHIPPGSHKVFFGAGVIVYEKIDNDYKIILAKNSHYRQYTAMDGVIDEEYLDSKDALPIIAKQEAFEESTGLVNLKLGDIDQKGNYVDVLARTGDGNQAKYYRIYFVCVSSGRITEKIHKKHMKIVRGPGFGACLRETCRLDGFSLKYLLRRGILNETGDFKTHTIKRFPATIFARTVSALKRGVRKGIFNKPKKVVCISPDIKDLLAARSL